MGNCTAARSRGRRRRSQARDAKSRASACLSLQGGRHVHAFFHLFGDKSVNPDWKPGPFNLGRWSKPLTALSACWLSLAIVLFVLPQVSGSASAAEPEWATQGRSGIQEPQQQAARASAAKPHRPRNASPADPRTPDTP